MTYPNQSQQGFTLVELVAAIVLLGIVAVSSTQFMRQGVQVYVDSARRDNLQQQARFAIERVTRELRNALPGSVRVLDDGTNQCIEFIPIIAATSYLSSIVNSTISQLDIVDVGYSFPTSGSDRLAIYTFDNNSVYGGSPSMTNIVSAIAGPVANTQRLNFSALTVVNESPTRRAYIVAGAKSFCVSDGQLRSHQGYPLSASPPTAANGILLAEDIRVNDNGAVTVFTHTVNSLQRAGVVLIDFRFQDLKAGDEWLRFNQAVFVRNVP
ncbi:type II secretion system protein J [Oceanicoccus sp. KOV_DT_Chl]|uniref:PulJ/GspJ family protein n=1 Tax=Oceanicoccus sp. KOV_DT_Chl TaxID=1904639 RepID=UPI000C7B8496|nr:type II secretion system protein [Oceanicoccus sp. KOV_DT_Chl]